MEKSYLHPSAFDGAQWQKSSLSEPLKDCVELATVGETVGVRDSKTPSAGILQFTREEIRAFIAGAKNGDFDHLTE
ncbi:MULTISPECIES: DUF397 domain-containing protein [Amycolatopsis]|uniref:Uncharacterized protein DUF397 n=1 Tax=Amycolatopsis cihanbeyliensis TaxID=1128664 RepID=A0A542CV18_AMYCI|nr:MULTISPECIES: DUF397 domain-containing protein [Amycolatopsis]TQI94662.1 uncharacterized protein DUF397 [Amycolatopsis cihanbeyliensis]